MVFLKRDRRRNDQRGFKMDTRPMTVPNNIGTKANETKHGICF